MASISKPTDGPTKFNARSMHARPVPPSIAIRSANYSMNLRDTLSVTIVLLVIAGCHQREPMQIIMVSGKLPEDASPTGEHASVGPDQTLPVYTTSHRDCFYVADGSRNVVMVLPPDDQYVGESGASLQLPFIDAKVRRQGEIKIIPDWGYEVQLSLWTALYCCGEGCVGCEPADDSTPKMIYIRSTPL